MTSPIGVRIQWDHHIVVSKQLQINDLLELFLLVLKQQHADKVGIQQLNVFRRQLLLEHEEADVDSLRCQPLPLLQGRIVSIVEVRVPPSKRKLRLAIHII